MQLASVLVTGIGALLFGAALLWFGMPNKAGASPRFLRNGLVQMIYPAIVLGVMVVGVVQLLLSW
jgi:hypothetical protein